MKASRIRWSSSTPRAGLAEGLGQRLGQPVPVRARRDEDQAGLDAELADAEGDRAREPAADLLGALGGGRRGDHDGVEGAELPVEGDGYGPGRGRVEQGAPAPDGAGEPGGGDERVADQLQPGVEPVDHRDHIGREPGGDGGPAQQGAAQRGGGRVVGVRLDDHRAAGGERARGVAAGNGEGEREVGGGVDGDHAQRHLVAAQFRARRGEGGVGVVDADVEVRALVGGVGEGPQLAGGAAELAGEAGCAERGLGVGGSGHLGGGPVEQVGGRAQEGGADGPVGERAAGRVGGAHGLVHLAGGGLVADLFAPLPGAGGSTLQTGVAAMAHCLLVVGSTLTRAVSFSILNAVPVDE
ncbi:hypothetical protein GCM10020254_62880 [Streptomyces goshikiensis]